MFFLVIWMVPCSQGEYFVFAYSVRFKVHKWAVIHLFKAHLQFPRSRLNIHSKCTKGVSFSARFLQF